MKGRFCALEQSTQTFMILSACEKNACKDALDSHELPVSVVLCEMHSVHRFQLVLNSPSGNGLWMDGGWISSVCGRCCKYTL